jgi:acyl dehydratase
MPTIFKHPQDLLNAAGIRLADSQWLTITQERIQKFADATDDQQWIHVDPVRAAKGPFGKCIAHGYLTLSLVNHFMPQLIEVQGISMGINYGCDRVRFPAAVPVGSKLRGIGEITKVEEIKGCIQATIRVTVELAGGDRPACVVDTINRYYPS